MRSVHSPSNGHWVWLRTMPVLASPGASGWNWLTFRWRKRGYPTVQHKLRVQGRLQVAGRSRLSPTTARQRAYQGQAMLECQQREPTRPPLRSHGISSGIALRSGPPRYWSAAMWMP